MAMPALKSKAWMAVSSTAMTEWVDGSIGHDGWYDIYFGAGIFECPCPRLRGVFCFAGGQPFLAEHFADFYCQGVQGEGFDDDVHAGGQEAGAGGGVFGVAGDE